MSAALYPGAANKADRSSSVYQIGDRIHRQEQLQRPAGQGHEAELSIELSRLVVQCIDDHSVNRHCLAGLGDTLEGIGEQDRAKPLSLMRFRYGKSSQQGRGYRVSGQLALMVFWKVYGIQTAGAETVVAGHLFRAGGR